MTGYPIPTSLPTAPPPERPDWPGWTGLRVAEDHTKHAAKSGPTDREAGE